MAQRPQQPATGAPAASLPTETLAQILVCALEGLAPWERQQERVRFSKVCSGWYQVAETGKELVVKDTKMAERLTKALTVGGAARRQKVSSLVITVENQGIGRGQKLGALIKLCRLAISLELHGLDTWLGASDFLGSPLREALKELRHLHRFCPVGQDLFWLPFDQVCSLLKNWPVLRELGLIHCGYDSYGRARPGLALASVANNLVRLSVSIDAFGPDDEMIPSLVTTSASTLRHLDIGVIDELGTPGPLPVMTPVVAVAPQLHSFRALSKSITGVTASRYLVPILRALRDVRTLELGLIGYPLSALFPTLRHLQQLTNLSISNGATSRSQAIFNQLTPKKTRAFLSSSVSLQILTLPRQYMSLWSKEDRIKLAKRARKHGVRCRYG